MTDNITEHTTPLTCSLFEAKNNLDDLNLKIGAKLVSMKNEIDSLIGLEQLFEGEKKLLNIIKTQLNEATPPIESLLNNVILIKKIYDSTFLSINKGTKEITKYGNILKKSNTFEEFYDLVSAKYSTELRISQLNKDISNDLESSEPRPGSVQELKHYDNIIFSVLPESKQDLIKSIANQKIDINNQQYLIDTNYEIRKSSSNLTDYSYSDVLLKSAKLENYKVDISENIMKDSIELDMKLLMVNPQSVFNSVEFKHGQGMGSLPNLFTTNNRAAKTTIINTEDNTATYVDLLIKCIYKNGSAMTPEMYLSYLELIVFLNTDLIHKICLRTNSLIDEIRKRNSVAAEFPEQSAAYNSFNEEKLYRARLIHNYEVTFNSAKNTLDYYVETLLEYEITLISYEFMNVGQDAALKNLKIRLGLDETADLETKHDDDPTVFLLEETFKQLSKEKEEKESLFIKFIKLIYTPSNTNKITKRLTERPNYIEYLGKFLYSNVKQLYGRIYATELGVEEQEKRELYKALSSKQPILAELKKNLAEKLYFLKKYNSEKPDDYGTDVNFISNLNILLTKINSVIDAPIHVPAKPKKGGATEIVKKAKTLRELVQLETAAKKECSKLSGEWRSAEEVSVDSISDFISKNTTEFSDKYISEIEGYFETNRTKAFKKLSFKSLIHLPTAMDKTTLDTNLCEDFIEQKKETQSDLACQIIVPKFAAFLYMSKKAGIDGSITKPSIKP